MELIEVCNGVIDKHQCRKYKGHLIDVVTANLLVTVYNALESDKAKAKFDTLPVERLVEICWRVAR